VSKRTTSATRRAMQLNDCGIFARHHWHATFAVGEFLCTVCGVKASCPDCTPHFSLKGKRLHLCDEHRAQREARTGQSEVHP